MHMCIDGKIITFNIKNVLHSCQYIYNFTAAVVKNCPPCYMTYACT